MDKLKRFFLNGILMTLVSLLVRYVSVGFNVYLSNKIGAVAMGLFTLISSVYGFALTLATSGISLATTKLASEAMGITSSDESFSRDGAISAVMKKSILFSLSVSSVSAIALFVSSGYIGKNILGDARTVSSLQILAFSLPPIALSSSLGGYFSALRKVYKNAAVQIFSQAARIYICVVLLSYAVAKDMESACIAIVIATTVSEFLGFVLHAVLFFFERRKIPNPVIGKAEKQLSEKLLKITLPVAFSAYMRSALVTVEHILIPFGLERSGATRDLSLAAYGTLHSVVFPLVLFPSSISSSFAGLLVPEISESNAAGDKARIERIVSKVMKTVLIYSIGAAGIMTCLANELGFVLFPMSDSARFILMISPLVPVMYLDTSVDSILKGLGYQFYTMVVNIVDASLSVLLVWLLLPKMGINGYIVTVYFTEIVNATLSITKLLCVTGTGVRVFDWIVKPMASVIAATGIMRFILERSNIFATCRLELFLHVALTALIYFVILIACKAVSFKKIMRTVTGVLKS